MQIFRFFWKFVWQSWSKLWIWYWELLTILLELKKTNQSTKTDTLKTIIQNVRNWYLFAVFTNTNVSLASKHPTWAHMRHAVHYIYSSSRVLDFANPSQNANNVFVFEGSLPIKTVSESPSSSESALLCTSELLYLFFDLCFVFFFQCPFSYHCTI